MCRCCVSGVGTQALRLWLRAQEEVSCRLQSGIKKAVQARTGALVTRGGGAQCQCNITANGSSDDFSSAHARWPTQPPNPVCASLTRARHSLAWLWCVSHPFLTCPVFTHFPERSGENRWSVHVPIGLRWPLLIAADQLKVCVASRFEKGTWRVGSQPWCHSLCRRGWPHRVASGSSVSG